MKDQVDIMHETSERARSPSLVAVDQASARPGIYHEIAPFADLRDHVECFWHRAAGAARSDRWVLPDGCIDVIWMGNLAPFIAGPATLVTMVEPAAGAEVVGVRFRPGVAPNLLGVSARTARSERSAARDLVA